MRILITLFFLSTTALAHDRLGLTVGGATREKQVALDVSRFWRVSDTRLHLGTGLRFTSQWATGQNFRTAPAELTRGVGGPAALFRKEKKSNIDDLVIDHSQVSSLNVLFQAIFRLSEHWALGFNIDVIGFSWGQKRKGRYNPKSEDGSWPEEVSARPTAFNLLLGDDNDRGSINSEFSVHRDMGDGLGLKLGLVHAFTEYRTSQRLRKDNDRFRKKNYLPTIGITKAF